ncbi:MAG: glycosyltransferase family 39 protein [Bacteroidetes bacterium]|nr:glycosyltransferase family 39 protein [Bacteroidota bacterium]
MSSFYNDIINYINDGKNLKKIIFFLVVFLCIVKLPPLLSTDIQPWDEGMYATRVLSIHTNGDFFDQSSHAVGKFYSGSHPPLLIWIGYFTTLIFGVNSVTLKMIPFISSLLCVVFIILIGKRIQDIKTGVFASLIFSSNIIFNVFSKRFQFDIPYTLLILIAFYLFILYNEKQKSIYNIIGGVVFGLCLMIKILVGFYIPIILFLSFLFLRKKINYKFKDLLVFTLIGIVIALPWHIYMFVNHGNDFMQYFLYYHIFERAFTGVEQNVKGSGIFYHINYLLSIIPFSILVFISLIKDFFNIKNLNWKKLFLWIWFLTGLFIITVFKTKLEVYILLILTPGTFLIVLYINELSKCSFKEKLIVVFLTLFNVLWFATYYYRAEVKAYLTNASNIITSGLIILILILFFYFVSRFIARKFDLVKIYYIFIILFFISINIYHLVKIPNWENTYKISSIKETIESSGRKDIIYISTNYRHNPQFSFFFNGLNLGWEGNKFTYELLDTKDGIENLRTQLETLDKNNYEIIIEGDNINRSDYIEPDAFIPEDFRFIKKTPGYKLFEN